MSIEFFSNDRARLQAPYLSVDVQGRIYLSKPAQELLGCVGTSAHLYVGYDVLNKRIGLAKPDIVKLTDTNAFKFNEKRAYASCRSFLDHYGIMPSGSSDRYIYDGQDRTTGVHLFRKEGAVAVDEPNKPLRGRGRPSKAELLARQQAEEEAAKANNETAAVAEETESSNEGAE